MHYYLFLISLFLIPCPARGDDLDPPSWRGMEGSTFQSWGFKFAADTIIKETQTACRSLDDNKTPWGHRGSPDKVDNPYQQQTGICVEYKTMWPMTDKIDWLEEYNGRQGVWRLKDDSSDFSSIAFIIPGIFSEKATSKETRVQITYTTYNKHPKVKILILPRDKSTDYTYIQANYEYQSALLPNGWLERTFVFDSENCPLFENVRILPHTRDEIYIDNVVIDTICQDNKVESEK
jgi:hypothetical protein